MNTKQMITVAAFGLFLAGSALARGGGGGGGGRGGQNGGHNGGDDGALGNGPGSAPWIAYSSAAKELGALLSSGDITQDSALAVTVKMPDSQTSQLEVETSDSTFSDWCVLEERTVSLDCGHSPYYTAAVALETGSKSWALAASLEQVLKLPLQLSNDSAATLTASARRVSDDLFAVTVDGRAGVASFRCALVTGSVPTVTCTAD